MALKLKKLICAAVAVLCVGVIGADAKVQPHALGVRLTGIGGSFGEINYQGAARLFGSKRFEIGANIGGNSNDYWLGAAAVAQWYWNLSRTTARGGFNWYAGPGVGAGLHSYKKSDIIRWETNPNPPNNTWPVYGDPYMQSDLYVNVGGQIGIEYDFNAVGVPLNISLDTRPMINLLGDWAINLFNICLAARFTF